jgi:hypothetical protein
MGGFGVSLVLPCSSFPLKASDGVQVAGLAIARTLLPTPFPMPLSPLALRIEQATC